MKDQAIQKINKIGKISSVVALIGKILVGMGLAFTLIATIVCFLLPRDLMQLNADTTMGMSLNIASLDTLFSEEEIATMLTEAKVDLETDEELKEEYEEVITEITDTGIHFTGNFEMFTFDIHDCAIYALWGAFTLGLTFVTLCFISSVCKAFRDCQSPFEDNVIKKMQNLAYALIPWALVSTFSNSITESMANNHLSLMFSIDLGVVLIVLVVLVLVYIFKYGAVLQQESDETL